jgi:uncharacterized membrane protein
MKAIKVILVIVTLLVVVFFSTGLIVKETTYQVKIQIDKPIKKVFSVFNNQELMKEWMTDVKSVIPINIKPGIVGSEYKMILENQGKEVEMIEKVLAFIPNKKVTLFFDADDMLKTDEYSFSFSEGKTTIVKDVVSKSDSYLMSCMFPYFKGMFTEIDQKYLEDFKVYIEKQ